MRAIWEDTSRFSSTEKDRAPNQWTVEIDGVITIVIHRHKEYAPDIWLCSCQEIGMDAHELRNKPTELAKFEAVRVVHDWLDERLQAIRKRGPA